MKKNSQGTTHHKSCYLEHHECAIERIVSMAEYLDGTNNMIENGVPFSPTSVIILSDMEDILLGLSNKTKPTEAI